jgi:hypothetical protein
MSVYLRGNQLTCGNQLTRGSVAIAIGAINMEVSIIGTSLVRIVEDLKGFDKQGWVVTGYLITYTSESRIRTSG